MKTTLGPLPLEAAGEVLEVWRAPARQDWAGARAEGVMPEDGAAHPDSVWAVDDFLDGLCGLRGFCQGRQTLLAPSRQYSGK